jgi:hypothetical protein
MTPFKLCGGNVKLFTNISIFSRYKCAPFRRRIDHR